MAVFNGTDLILKLSSSSGGSEFKLLHATSCTISMSSDTIDITDKDSSGFLTQLQGQKSHTLQADGLMDFTSAGTTTDPDEIFTQMMNRTTVSFTFQKDPAEGVTYTGSGIITSLEISGGVEDAPVYSVSLQGTGTLTTNVV
jgi:TP901-1 family phage major tail protein